MKYGGNKSIKENSLRPWALIPEDNILFCIGDNENRLIFEIWWNFFYDLFSIKNVADVNSIDSFVSKHNIPFSAENKQND
jgi:hypothetical protein